MEEFLWGLVGLLSAVILLLLAKIHLLRRSAEEICGALSRILPGDTNILIDISSRDPRMRKLAAELNVQLRRLREERRRFQQGDLELKEAVTNISHDLRTPLTTICGYLDLLEREEKSEAAARYLTHIKNRTDALRDLTEELFRYSIAASSHDWKPQKINLAAALEESLLSFCEIMREKGIRPQVTLAEGPVWRLLDPAALNRIFSNIIGNALKYSDGDFSADMDKNGNIIFSNTARGLNPVTAGRLFDRFYTVETGRSSTGLGLSIAKLLTEQMGGQIEAGHRDGILSIRLYFPEDKKI